MKRKRPSLSRVVFQIKTVPEMKVLLVFILKSLDLRQITYHRCVDEDGC